jgi:hypothetical protein
VEIRGGVILHGSDYLIILCAEMFGYPEDQARLLVRLGLSEAEVLPIMYTLRVPVEGEPQPRTGSMD